MASGVTAQQAEPDGEARRWEVHGGQSAAPADGLWITRVAKSEVLASVFRAGPTRGGREGTHGTTHDLDAVGPGEAVRGGADGVAWPGPTWLVGLVTAVAVLSGCQSDATPPATTSPSAVGHQCVAEPERVVAVAVGECVGGDPRGRAGEVGEGS